MPMSATLYRPPTKNSRAARCASSSSSTSYDAARRRSDSASSGASRPRTASCSGCNGWLPPRVRRPRKQHSERNEGEIARQQHPGQTGLEVEREPEVTEGEPELREQECSEQKCARPEPAPAAYERDDRY